MQVRTHTGEEINQALEALRQLEQQRPGLTAKLILYTDGEGAAVLEDLRFRKFRAAVDFTETANLLQVVQKLSECENLLEE